MTNNRNGLANIIQKEFTDHIKSGKFIIVFIIFLLISAYSLHEGIRMYHDELDRYKEHIAAPPEHIAAPSPTGDDYIGIPIPYMPGKPSALLAFIWMSMVMPILGAILAAIMGFDVVSKERQDRTLKTLLSHPIYRDEIINGKAIGGLLVIIIAIGITFAISIAMLLLSAIVPTIDEFISIGLFGVISVLMLVSYFSIALMSSVLFKNSGFSIIFTLGIIFVIAIILPIIGMFASYWIVGPFPEPPEIEITLPLMPEPTIIEGRGEVAPLTIDPYYKNEEWRECEEWKEWERKSAAHWERKMAIMEAFRILDPGTHFGRISGELGIGFGFGMPFAFEDLDEDPDIFDKLGAVWMNILALFIIPTVYFAVAYTKFMKLDIR